MSRNIKVKILGNEKLYNPIYKVPKDWLERPPKQVQFLPGTWEYIQFLAQSHGLNVQAEGHMDSPTLYIWDDGAAKGDDLVKCKHGESFDTEVLHVRDQFEWEKA